MRLVLGSQPMCPSLGQVSSIMSRAVAGTTLSRMACKGISVTCKDDVHHGDEHAVLLRVPRVLNDGDDVGPLLRHVHQVAACEETSRLSLSFIQTP